MLIRSRGKKKRPKQNSIEQPIVTRKKNRGWRRLLRTLVITFAVLVIVFLALSAIIVKYMNRKWATMPEYVGHLESLEFDVFNFSVTARNITIKKKNGKIPTPFIFVSSSTITVDWEAWEKGTKAAFILLDSIGVNIINTGNRELSQTPSDTAIFNLVDVMMPITRNKLEVKRGTINFKDTHGAKPVDIHLNRLYVMASNLENVVDSATTLPARVLIKANAYGGQLQLNLKVNSKSKAKMFDMDAKLTRLPLPNVNNLLREFAGFDVNKGYFSLYAEMASKEGRLRGYVDLSIEELDVFDRKTEKNEKGKQKNKERWIEFAGKLFTNRKEGTISTKIEIDGDLKNPKISIWQIIGQAITDAGAKSLTAGFDHSVSVNNIDKERKPNMLEKLFDKKVRKEEKAKRVKKREDKKEEKKEKRDNK